MANWAAFVLSRQSTQFTLRIPCCRSGWSRCGPALQSRIISSFPIGLIEGLPDGISSWPTMKEVGGLKTLLADVFEDPYDILLSTREVILASSLTHFWNLPFSSLWHIPSDIVHLLSFWQELIQIFDTLPVLKKQFAFTGNRFPGFYKV